MRYLEKVDLLRSHAARGFAMAALGSALCLAACTAEVETAHPVVVADDEAAVEVDTVPVVDVYAYPHTEYRGHAVYYVNGRWYYPRGRRWYTYRNEPQELVRHRQYIQQAPPARRPYEPRPYETQPR